MKSMTYVLSIIFLLISSIQYSWLPQIIMLPILLLYLSVFIVKTKINFFTIVIIYFGFFLVVFSFKNQIYFSFFFRNILLGLMSISTYYIFKIYAINFNKYMKLIKVLLIGSIVVVMYVFLISIPMDPNEFFGERRGYHAFEFLFFGKEFPNTIGVTHLNIYIMFIMTFIYIKFIYWNKPENKAILILSLLLLLFLALLSRSRSPILFFLVISFISLIYMYVYAKKNGKFRFYFKIFVSILVLVSVYIIYSYLGIIENNNRLNDTSRLFFWGKGIEHMSIQPWGNSLLYTDSSMWITNYHNTFLALGNRVSFLYLTIIIIYLIYIVYKIGSIRDKKQKISLYLLLYFSVHNFMIENVITIEYFVFIIFISLLPTTENILRIEKLNHKKGILHEHKIKK